MHPNRPASLITFVLIALLPASGLAQVYSWKDSSGKTHYGDRPPAERQADSRKLAAPPAVDVEAIRSANAQKQLDEREKQQKTKESASKAEEDQAATRQREENCRQAKSSLAALESGLIRFSMNTKGERIAIDGETREAELGKARKSVESWCKPAAK
jgi:type IV secretory pathway VirB10-like protein